jgi:hypothetical protein
MAVPNPDISFSRRATDFGQGFYTTNIIEQARKWTENFVDNRGTGVISIYEFLKPIDEFPKEIRLLEFNSHSERWLDFVTACRLRKPVDDNYDLIIGGVADDKVFETLTLYFENYINKREAIRRLKFNKPSYQYCFKTQKIIDKYLKFIGTEVIR